MAAQLHYLDQRRLIDTNGIADGASIYFYTTGTLTPAATYTTSALSVEHPHPIPVAAGAAVPNIYLNDAITYRRRIVYPDGSVDDTDPYISFFSATSISSDDGASGSLWTTVAGFITYLMSSAGSSIVGFVQAGVGAITRTLQAKLRDTISVKDFGAVGNGSTNDTAAIQAAFDAIDTLGGGTLYFPQGTYLVTSTLLYDGQRINIEGAGRQVSIIRFNPASADVCIELNSGAAGGQFQSSIRGLGFSSTNSTDKTAISLYNCANVFISEIATSTSGWLGTNSIGVRSYGRQSLHLEDSEIACARPVVFSQNPEWTSLSVDHFKIHHCELIGTSASYPCVEFEDGVSIGTTSVIGTALVGGKDGIRWVDTTSVSAGFHLAIRDCRSEQAEDDTGYALRLESTAQTLQELVVENCRFGNDRNGVYLRNVHRASSRNVTISGSAKVSADITLVANSRIEFDNCFADGTFTITNGRCGSKMAAARSGGFSEKWVYDVGTTYSAGAIQSDVYHGGIPFNLIRRTISGATQANPVVITTSADHGFANGDRVMIAGITGMVELNGNDYLVTVLTPTTFSLQNRDGTSGNINGTGFTPYVSGGNVGQTKAIAGNTFRGRVFIDTSTNVGATYYLRGTAGTLSERDDPDSSFSATKAAGGYIVYFEDTAYRIAQMITDGSRTISVYKTGSTL